MVHYNFKSVALPLVGSMMLAGCTSATVDTNRRVEITQNIVSNTDADVDIGEPIRGTGCFSQFPGSEILALFGGQVQFLQAEGIHDVGVVGMAKAVAAYNALNGGKGLTTDFIVQPTWEITQQRTLITRDTCATVVGYRGVIRGFRKFATPYEAADRGFGQPSISYPNQRLSAPATVDKSCTADRRAYAEKIGVSCSALGEAFIANSPG